MNPDDKPWHAMSGIERLEVKYLYAAMSMSAQKRVEWLGEYFGEGQRPFVLPSSESPPAGSDD